MILVTGASGLVGSHLVTKLVAAGKQVRALYRNTLPVFPGSGQVQWAQGDILDVVSLEEAMQGITEVYHCAATVSFHSRNKELLHQTNIQGTAHVVDACIEAGVRKLLFVSSVAALGRIREDRPIDETMNWSEETSNSEYGKTKFLAEMEVWRGIGEGLNAVIVNPVIILGAGDWEKGSSGIFKSAYDEFPWYTEGTGGFVDVQDVVKAMILLMETDTAPKRYILCGHNLSYRELFTTIARKFNKRPPHKKVTAILSAIVWRIEALKSFFTGKEPLLTRETARTARAKVQFDNSRLLQQFTDFSYTPLLSSIERICAELQLLHGI